MVVADAEAVAARAWGRTTAQEQGYVTLLYLDGACTLGLLTVLAFWDWVLAMMEEGLR